MLLHFCCSYRIIQRRVIWLIGCWVGVKLSNSLRSKLYESVIPFLDQSQDLVVRLEAALTLKSDILCDDDTVAECSCDLGGNITVTFTLWIKIIVNFTSMHLLKKIVYLCFGCNSCWLIREIEWFPNIFW